MKRHLNKVDLLAKKLVWKTVKAMKEIEVCAAVIIKDKKVLLTQRG